MRRSNILFAFGLSVIMFALGSCALPVTKSIVTDCPVPSQNCSPEPWKGLTIDTSEAAAKITGYKNIIEPVRSLNTSDDEWSLAFTGDESAVLTYNKNSLQRAISLKRTGLKNFTVESGLTLNMGAHYGLLSMRGGTACFAAQSNTLPADVAPADTGAFIRLEPVSHIIGRSRVYVGKFANNTVADFKQLTAERPDCPDEWQSQPALADNGSVVFFASDAPVESVVSIFGWRVVKGTVAGAAP